MFSYPRRRRAGGVVAAFLGGKEEVEQGRSYGTVLMGSRQVVLPVEALGCGSGWYQEPIFARTCCTRKVCVGTLLLVLLPCRSYGPASAHATVDVLLFLLCRLQDL